jgi:protein involved in polysaccharide export with SLBB domain
MFPLNAESLKKTLRLSFFFLFSLGVVQAAPPVLPAPSTHSAPAPPAGAFRSDTANTPVAAAAPVDRGAGAEAPIPTLMAGEGDYVLAAGDTIDLMVYKEPDLNMRSKIARDGRVQLPLLGDVAVVGMTVRQAQDHIKKLFNADYLVEPQVYLNIASYTQRKITLIGQVVRPGSYELMGNESLGILEAIGMAGGFTRIADSRNVTVKRVSGGKTQTIKVNTKRLEDPEGGSFQVLPGDIITVGESWY